MKRVIWVITLFPEFFEPLFNCGVVGQALRGERKLDDVDFDIEIKLLNLRDYSVDNWKGVDSAPFGGGPGMVMRADVLKNCFDQAILPNYEGHEQLHTIYTAPRGEVWSDIMARTMSSEFFNPKTQAKDLVFICGRYEGVDERFLQKYVDEFISLGDFVLSGGELAVMTILDSALRFSPGVLGNRASHEEDSFARDLIEYPQYTRPREFEGMDVPEVLTSGHHKNIAKAQLDWAIEMTGKYRPDLLEKYNQKNIKHGKKK